MRSLFKRKNKPMTDQVSPPATEPARPPVPAPQSSPIQHIRPTEQDLGELYTIVLRDIRAWSESKGFANVPPVIFLRQIAGFTEAMGTALHKETPHAGP